MNILSKINQMAKDNPENLIFSAEKAYDQELNKTVGSIVSNTNCKIVLLAGPSGSGKTTTAHIIKSKLSALGRRAEVISLDHFFLENSKMPRQENGEPDFESVYSLDIEEIHKCFGQLLNTEKTEIPIFDFINKKRADSKHMIDISGDGILIVEGLHAINPVLTDTLDSSKLLKIYISVNQSIYDDKENKILSSRQMRLIRRMSRDYIYRSTDAAGTLKLWTSVVKGEEKYLYCFKDTADIIFSTFHAYEPCVFKEVILDLLKDLPSDVDNYDYVMKVKKGLEMFCFVDIALIPENSLIKEFLPGGIYETHK